MTDFSATKASNLPLKLHALRDLILPILASD